MQSFLTSQITTKLIDLIPYFLFSFTSHHTRRSYLNDLKKFCDFLKMKDPNIISLPQITDQLISEWKVSMENEKLDQSTVRRRLNCVSALFEFSKKRKYIDSNPVDFVKKPIQKFISKTEALNPSDIQKLIINIDNKILNIMNSKEQHKYYKRKIESLELENTIIKVLSGTGLRVNEICSLKMKHLEIQTNHKGEKIFLLHIPKAKGSLEHKVFLNFTTAESLIKYIGKYRADVQNDDYIFTRVQVGKLSPSKPLTPKTVYEIVKMNAIEANIEKDVSPHSIRAGVATHLHSKGVPLARIQKQLGHRSITTTSVYIKKSNEIEESAALKLQLKNK